MYLDILVKIEVVGASNRVLEEGGNGVLRMDCSKLYEFQQIILTSEPKKCR